MPENTKKVETLMVILDGSTREVYSHPEELRNAYLEPPYVTRLCQKLGFKDTFLTVDEFISYKRNSQ